MGSNLTGDQDGASTDNCTLLDRVLHVNKESHVQPTHKDPSGL